MNTVLTGIFDLKQNEFTAVVSDSSSGSYVTKKQAFACFCKISLHPYGLPVLLKKLCKGIHVVNAAFLP